MFDVTSEIAPDELNWRAISYSSGLTSPTFCLSCSRSTSSMSAKPPANSGAAALVPPTVIHGPGLPFRHSLAVQ